MMMHIARKEILEHIKSFRFLVAFVFIVATFFIMMFTRHFEHTSQYDDYLLRLKAQDEVLENMGLAGFDAVIRPILPPSSMGIIVDSNTVLSSGRSLDDDPFDTINLNLDMVALVGALGSLLALLLSYDSINREVNEGTIRLLLSSGVPRMKIVFGKILGGSLAAMVPIAAVFLLTSIWLAIAGGLGFGLNEWLSLLGIFLLSLIYVMFFYCVGAFLSSVILDQTLSVLSCFGIWILLVIVVPAISPLIARAAVKVPDLGAQQRQVNQIMSSGQLPQDKFLEMLGEMQGNYKKAAARQTKLSIQVSCVSPYSIYLVAIGELSGLGFERSDYIDNLVSNWRQKANESIGRQFKEARERDPSNYMAALQSKINLPGFPRLQYVEPSLSFKYSSAMPYMLLLLSCLLVPIGLYLVTFNSKRRLF
jgi:ABC-type transport system involved in multi-copper enzyme maturation permease subunit